MNDNGITMENPNDGQSNPVVFDKLFEDDEFNNLVQIYQNIDSLKMEEFLNFVVSFGKAKQMFNIANDLFPRITLMEPETGFLMSKILDDLDEFVQCYYEQGIELFGSCQ